MTSACSRTFSASRGLPDFGFVDDHAERRLQRMGEIADLGARALDDLAIGVEQQIDLGGERRDVLRKFAR